MVHAEMIADSMTKHCIAVLGTGSAGIKHMHALESLQAAVIAVPTRPERTQVLRAEGWRVAASLEDAKAAGAVAAVIATDTARHAIDAGRALALGLHVLCEKPLATSVSAGREVPDVAARSGLLLCVGYCLRFDPGLAAFRARLQDVGELHSVRIECRSFLPDWRPARDYHDSYSARAAEGGVLRDLSHELDYACWVFGAPQSVSGTIRNTGRLGIESEEIAEAFWAVDGGPIVSLGLDYLSRSPVRFARASGSAGELEYDFVRRRLSLAQSGRPADVQDVPGSASHMYEAQMRQFLCAMRGGERGVLAVGTEALLPVSVSDSLKRSAASGRQEEVRV